jgi:hypothetical protein
VPSVERAAAVAAVDELAAFDEPGEGEGGSPRRSAVDEVLIVRMGMGLEPRCEGHEPGVVPPGELAVCWRVGTPCCDDGSGEETDLGRWCVRGERDRVDERRRWGLCHQAVSPSGI